MNNRQLFFGALKAAMPFKTQLRRFKRKFVPYTDRPENSDFCITQGLEQIRALRAAGVDFSGDVLEFGTGWLPLIPLLFHLAGARSLTLTDIERLMDDANIDRARALVAGRIADVAAVLGQREPDLLARLAEPMRFTYLVPWDAAAHEAASADIVVSRAVFEHVPQAALRGFLRQFHRILRPDGVMCHVIDNSDHWEHIDKSLSRISFLQYDRELRWKIANLESQNFQNQLRHSDYRRLFEEAGFTVAASEGVPDPTCLQELRTRKVADKFRSYEEGDLATLNSLFVVKRVS
jgi:SAM-dependent methyltransferase